MSINLGKIAIRVLGTRRSECALLLKLLEILHLNLLRFSLLFLFSSHIYISFMTPFSLMLLVPSGRLRCCC